METVTAEQLQRDLDNMRKSGNFNQSHSLKLQIAIAHLAQMEKQNALLEKLCMLIDPLHILTAD